MALVRGHNKYDMTVLLPTTISADKVIPGNKRILSLIFLRASLPKLILLK
jgi:hypothetical protein